MRVLIGCEESQAVCIEFRKKGHEAYSCDLIPCSGGHPEWHYQCNIFDVLLNEWDLVIAFPPCTDLASSGARWFEEKRKNGSQAKSIEFFMRLAEWPVNKLAIENPIGIMSNLFRKPDQIIQPWQFGHPETKSTCLWLKGLSLLKPTDIVDPDFMRKANGEYYKDVKGKRYSRIHFMSRSNPDRAKERSKTYPGIAKAMAEQWGVLEPINQKNSNIMILQKDIEIKQVLADRETGRYDYRLSVNGEPCKDISQDRPSDFGLVYINPNDHSVHLKMYRNNENIPETDFNDQNTFIITVSIEP